MCEGNFENSYFISKRTVTWILSLHFYRDYKYLQGKPKGNPSIYYRQTKKKVQIRNEKDSQELILLALKYNKSNKLH